MPEPRFTDIRRFDSIDSTNQYLLDEARRGAPEGVVAVAEHQSAGRGGSAAAGRLRPARTCLFRCCCGRISRPITASSPGRSWRSRPRDSVGESTGLGLGIKWPNDLLAPDGRKVAGVLAEADLQAGSGEPGEGGPERPPEDVPARPPIVVGIGINVNWPGADADLPDELIGRATSLREQIGHPVDRHALLASLLAALGPRVADLGSAAGRRRQRADFRAGCTTIGTAVRVELPGEQFDGTAVDLTPEGHLVVAVGDARRTVVAGDVVHLRSAD